MTTKSTRRHNSATNSFLQKLNGGPLTFGQALATIRLADELSLATFAERLGVSRTHLSDIEHGRRSVSLLRASEFATALGHSEAQFVRLALQDQVRDAGLKLKVDVHAA
jgi:antitoxin HigA-1